VVRAASQPTCDTLPRHRSGAITGLAASVCSMDILYTMCNCVVPALDLNRSVQCIDVLILERLSFILE
jgi:hypothetical protein